MQRGGQTVLMLHSNAYYNYYNHLRRSLVIADSAQTCIDCKFALQSVCGIVCTIQWPSQRHRYYSWTQTQTQKHIHQTDIAQTYNDCIVCPSFGSYYLNVGATQWPSHRHKHKPYGHTQTDRVQTCIDHKPVPHWKILAAIWVSIHGLMPSPSNPCPAGQGYMAVHQGSHNSACFIAPSVHQYTTVSRREEEGLRRMQSVGGMPPSRTAPPKTS